MNVNQVGALNFNLVDFTSDESIKNSFLELLCANVPTVSSIPKRVRLDITLEITKLQKAIKADPSNLESHAHFLFFSKLVLRRIPKSNLANRKRQALQIALIRDNLKRFKAGGFELRGLYLETLALVKNVSISPLSFDDLEDDSKFLKKCHKS